MESSGLISIPRFFIQPMSKDFISGTKSANMMIGKQTNIKGCRLYFKSCPLLKCSYRTELNSSVHFTDVFLLPGKWTRRSDLLKGNWRTWQCCPFFSSWAASTLNLYMFLFCSLFEEHASCTLQSVDCKHLCIKKSFVKNSGTVKYLQYFSGQGKLGSSPAVQGIHLKEETWVAVPLLMIVPVLDVKHLLM